MSSTLWQKSTFISKYEYLIDSIIREYDISKANISVLRDANVLSEEQYQYYMNAPRMVRQVDIGKLQGSNPEITRILKDGIKEARRIFMESNNLDDRDILYIRNDAIAVIGFRPINYLKISEHVSFRQSAQYSSFYRYNFISFLYYYDPVSRTENLDIKGLGDEAVELHRKFILDFLCELFYRIQTEGITEGIKLLRGFYDEYVNKRLSIGYYRELNPSSNFKLDGDFSLVSNLYLYHAAEYDRKHVDISCNEEVLRHFMKILSTVYFK